MAALFALAVVVQYNDPDPVAWVLVYGAACAVSAMAAAGKGARLAPALAVSAISLVWGLRIALDVPDLDVYRHMFDAWEMRSAPIEQAREATGLFVVGCWMAIIAAGEGRRLKGRTRET